MARPFRILVDTRERRPLKFPSTVQIVRVGLKTGDYTTEDLLDRVTIERKSVPDLVGSFTTSRDRFFRELERLRPYEFKCVVIEGRLSNIVAGKYRSAANPSSIVGSVIAAMVDYAIPFYFVDNAKTAAIFVEKTLRRLESKLLTRSVADAA